MPEATEPMEQDGYLHVELDEHGTFEDYPFKDIKGWIPRWGCLLIDTEQERIVYPLTSIFRFTVVKNSPEYVAQAPVPEDEINCNHCGSKAWHVTS